MLKAGNFEINLIYRRIGVQEFLVKFSLAHPLVAAYRDKKVCVVNSFRSELAQKRAMFSLLTDDALTAKVSPAERKAIRDHLPWTRLVKAGMTTHGTDPINLLDYIHEHREKLVLKPNDDNGDEATFVGASLDQAGGNAPFAKPSAART